MNGNHVRARILTHTGKLSGKQLIFTNAHTAFHRDYFSAPLAAPDNRCRPLGILHQRTALTALKHIWHRTAHINVYYIKSPQQLTAGHLLHHCRDTAQQLNRRGHAVTIFEREDRVGGLLMYGIPNMKLEKRIVQRRVELMAAEGVEFRTGCDVGRDLPAQALLEEYDAVVLCCGAKNPRPLPPAEGILGAYFAVDYLTAATKALLDGGAPIDAAGKDVVVVGGGDTGNDCVGTAIRQGCRSVIQLEMMPQLPAVRAKDNPWPQWPRVCKTDYGQEEAAALFGADPRRYQTTVKECRTDEAGALSAVVTVRLEPKEEDGRRFMAQVPDSEEELPCQLLLIAAGFLGPEDYAADAFGLSRNGRSNVSTAPDSHATGVNKVFAAGDMRRGQSLVVWAIAEGRAAAREADEYLMGYSNLN